MTKTVNLRKDPKVANRLHLNRVVRHWTECAGLPTNLPR